MVSHSQMAQDAATPHGKDTILTECLSHVFPNPDQSAPWQYTNLIMQLTYNQKAAARGTGISFPRLECWNALSNVATIAANVDKRRVLCRISLQILQDKFGATESEPMQSVAQHRTIIEEAARNLIERGDFEEDGSITIQAKDF